MARPAARGVLTLPLEQCGHMNALSISFDDVARAHERLAGVAHRTPVFSSATADAQSGATLFFKCENLQRIGAFKIRGAYNAIAQFTRPSSAWAASSPSRPATTARRSPWRRDCSVSRRLS